ncbi:MAG: DUF465 domain-containing protein [Rickettsiaceae bacterium]|nr:DUF465 domain-containing protein [Rickettsiaceae bacterium]
MSMSYIPPKDMHLDELKQEHSDLNELIDDSEKNKNLSEFTIQKLKKRKLFLKDKISNLSTKLYPDIIA